MYLLWKHKELLLSLRKSNSYAFLGSISAAVSSSSFYSGLSNSCYSLYLCFYITLHRARVSIILCGLSSYRWTLSVYLVADSGSSKMFFFLRKKQADLFFSAWFRMSLWWTAIRSAGHFVLCFSSHDWTTLDSSEVWDYWADISYLGKLEKLEHLVDR